jgi:hypothetical protein
MKRQEAETQAPLHPSQASLGYFLVWFQSLQLPSTQSESPLALIHLAPKSHVSFKVNRNFRFFISIWIIRHRINCNRISEGLQY